MTEITTMHVSVHLAGVEYSGTGTWEIDKGFSADLRGLYDSHRIDQNNGLPDALAITVDHGKKYILVHPFLRSFGGLNFRRDGPVTTSIELCAHEMVVDVPWGALPELTVRSIEIASSGLDLWYGDMTAKLDYDYTKQIVKARFSTSERKYTTKYGNLSIGLSFTPPGRPYQGNYNFRTKPYARLDLSRPIPVTETSKLARTIAGYFDLLAGFPRAQMSLKIKTQELDHEVGMALALGYSENREESHPFSVFIPKAAQPSFVRSFEKYLEKYDTFHIMQSVLHYLSRENLMYPEGFLTACNVFETIGNVAPVSNRKLAKQLERISNFLNSRDKVLGHTFDCDIRSKLSTTPSFRDRYEYGCKLLAECGVEVTLKARSVSGVRGTYRHNILALKDNDIKMMQAGVGLAWFLGMVWLCREIGISKKVRSRAAQRETFHSMRRTALPLWGKISSTGSPAAPTS